MRRQAGILPWVLGGMLLGLLAALVTRRPAPDTLVHRPAAAGRAAALDAGARFAAPARPPVEPLASAPAEPATSRPASVALPAPASPSACPAGMRLVQGDWCPYLTERCADWIDPERDRCQRYVKPTVCHGRLIPKRFCIDSYEFPNEKGVLPAVMVSWLEARKACKAEGKRLCTDSEWTFACEGTARLPYPYGYVRDPVACNIDRPTVLPDFKAFIEPRRVADEVFLLDQRVPSGSMPRCVSPFGVHDMTGNVDEWVVNESGEPHRSGLKGGYFGKIRARCRPMTTDHNEWFRFYQVGFRCCAGARPGASGEVAPAAASPVLP